MTKSYIIKKLKLIPLEPEGGFFNQIYKSKLKVKTQFGKRHSLTSIFYLIDSKNKSHFHKLKSDEIYHFYFGDTAELFLINKNGKINKIKLGQNLKNGEFIQYVVPANTWQALRVQKNGKYSLLGTTMSPGFDEKDFILANSNELLKLCPKESKLIKEMTRSNQFLN